MSKKDLEYRVVVMGLGYVGKSAMTVRLMNGKFIEKYDPTIEDSYMKQMEVDGNAVCLDILDTSGQEEYSTLRDTYIRTTNAFLIVYSITSVASWKNVSKLLDRARTIRARDIAVVLCGNKCDLETEREVPSADVTVFATDNNIKYNIETSAKIGTNITEAFEMVIRSINEWRKNHPDFCKKKKKECRIL